MHISLIFNKAKENNRCASGNMTIREFGRSVGRYFFLEFFRKFPIIQKKKPKLTA